jgi:transposase
MNKKYKVKLNEVERKQIFEIMDSKKTSKTVRRRCNILLLLDEGAGKPNNHKDIAKRCQVSEATVGIRAKDYCLKGIEYVLRHRTHAKPPTAPIVNGEIEARIVALACSEPPDGYSRWSIRLLTKRIVELNIVVSIGRETVRQTLKKLNLNLTGKRGGVSPRSKTASS